ncbi:MAG TPA: PQQ-dependent sugar dehydrogenase, partial [Caldilineaceae bacterium]|nr:PQQ-dependent sugar dehydrogenase [Caldilineaceae bacterium]
MVVKRFGLVAIVALLLLAIPLWLQPAVWGQEVGDTQPDHERVNDEGTVGAAALTLPPGFVSEVVIDSLSSPTTIAFGPENRVFIGQKNGFVRVWQDGVLLPTPFIDLRAEVNTVVDRGLLGIAVHPQFPTQPYIYLLYTYDPPGVALDKAGARVSRLLRVTADAAQNYNVASTAADARQVILGKNSTLDNIGNVDIMTDNDHPSCWNATTSTYVVDCLPSDSQTHSIGTVRFAADGSLFVGAGEGAMPDYVDPRALRALDVDSLAGKILRINPETGQGYADNPFYDGNLASNRSRVYSYGLRNPFRFTLHPTTGELYLGDVGWNQWEEVNSGRAKNFGWPCYEGNNVTSAQQKGYANNVDTQARCAALYAQGLDAVTAPLVAYNHMGLGAAVSGVAIYTGTGYPVEYQGVPFVSDYNSDWIQYVTTDESGKGTLHPFAEDVSPDGGPVQLLIGPDGNLIYVIYNKGTNTSEVRRIRYTSSANTPPTAIAKAAPLSGSPPLTVTFSATESFDPDGQNLQYFWLFGDGASATTVTATHVYNAVGVFPVRLWVTDTLGAGSVDQLLVETDNNAPVITITLPVSGTTFSVGDTISFSGSAADAAGHSGATQYRL